MTPIERGSLRRPLRAVKRERDRKRGRSVKRFQQELAAMKALAAIAVLAAGLPHCAVAQSIAFQRSGDIAWACGGVGSDERRALQAMRGEASLEILLVTAPRGAYLAGVQIAIAPASGRVPETTLVADGPTCLVQAPAGRYRIEGTYHGVARSTTASVAGRPGKPARVVLSFPDDESDGIRASEEEKRQANSP
jgi:hypothetical protein